MNTYDIQISSEYSCSLVVLGIFVGYYADKYANDLKPIIGQGIYILIDLTLFDTKI